MAGEPVAALPIGPGQARRRWRAVDDSLDDQLEGEPAAPSRVAGGGTLVELPALELVTWDAGKLRAPLKLVGKTVNWRVRARVGVDTDAGVMTDENLTDIGEPLSEVLNRYEPTRALAEHAAELALASAIYQYVQETAVKAGRSKQRVLDVERAAAAARAAATTAPPPPTVVREGHESAIDSEEGIEL